MDTTCTDCGMTLPTGSRPHITIYDCREAQRREIVRLNRIIESQAMLLRDLEWAARAAKTTEVEE